MSVRKKGVTCKHKWGDISLSVNQMKGITLFHYQLIELSMLSSSVSGVIQSILE